jgi:hypothetical protein
MGNEVGTNDGREAERFCAVARASFVLRWMEFEPDAGMS